MLISSFFKISCNLAFCVFKTFPRNGRIAWNLRSRPCLADPPAESPSTRNNSLRLALRDCAGVNLPESNRSFLCRFLPFRLSSRALRAASRASLALIDFLTRSLAKSPFSSK